MWNGWGGGIEGDFPSPIATGKVSQTCSAGLIGPDLNDTGKTKSQDPAGPSRHQTLGMALVNLPD